MTILDFGSPPPAPRAWGQIVLISALGFGLTAAGTIPRLLSDRAAAIAEAKAWTIDGPPCPQLPPAEAARWPYKATQTFDYAGTTFGRMVGHVACAQIHDDDGKAMFRGYPVCQFTSPAVVSVDTGKTAAFFTPGLGRRATVSVRNGVARCVMAGDFYGQNDF